MLLSVGGLSVPQEAVGDRIPVLLLGNKVDNEKEREVPWGLGERLAKVRGKHPRLSGQGGTPRGVGHVPQSRAGTLLWEPPVKSAGGLGGVPASGAGPTAARGSFRRELDSGVGNFPDSLLWNSEL